LKVKKHLFFNKYLYHCDFFENFLIQTEQRLSNVTWFVEDIKGLFISKRITYVDLYGFDTLSLLMGLQPSILDPFPKLKDFFFRIPQRPNLRTYLCSNRRPLYPHSSTSYYGNEAHLQHKENNPASC